MIIAATIILTFTLIQLLVVLTNLILNPVLKEQKVSAGDLVSILIPARNEEKNLPHLLSDLQNQTHTNLEILIFDDESTDNTAQVIASCATGDNRIRYYKSEGLPSGWLGKNYACHRLSEYAQGDYYLFLDADVRTGEQLITRTLSYMKRHELKLLSIFPVQTMITPGEKVSVPNMNYILLTLLPLILVRKAKAPSLSAANGQFMLFEAKTYQRWLPHQEVRIKKAEDIEIARFYKSQGERIACLAGNKDINCRMYSNLQEAIEGFSKNVVMFFGNSFILAFLFWLITSLGFIIILIVFPIEIFMTYLVIYICIRIIVSLISLQPVWQNLALIIPQQVTLALFIREAIKNKFTKNYIWKARNISL